MQSISSALTYDLLLISKHMTMDFYDSLLSLSIGFHGAYKHISLKYDYCFFVFHASYIQNGEKNTLLLRGDKKI